MKFGFMHTLTSFALTFYSVMLNPKISFMFSLSTPLKSFTQALRTETTTDGVQTGVFVGGLHNHLVVSCKACVSERHWCVWSSCVESSHVRVMIQMHDFKTAKQKI